MSECMYFQSNFLLILLLILTAVITPSCVGQSDFETQLIPELVFTTTEVEFAEGYCHADPSLNGEEVKLYWMRWRPVGDKPTRKILFHHGWTGDAASWTVVAYNLAATGDYETVAFSTRGTGGSSSPSSEQDYTIKIFVLDQMSGANCQWGREGRVAF